jgi:hypothetical protein
MTVRGLDALVISPHHNHHDHHSRHVFPLSFPSRHNRYPPIFYMNDVSKAIVGVLSRYNTHAGLRAAYTFDAGPNCVVYCLKVCACDSCVLLYGHCVCLPICATFFSFEHCCRSWWWW